MLAPMGSIRTAYRHDLRQAGRRSPSLVPKCLPHLDLCGVFNYATRERGWRLPSRLRGLLGHESLSGKRSRRL
jgi:hypothetical protein